MNHLRGMLDENFLRPWNFLEGLDKILVLFSESDSSLIRFLLILQQKKFLSDWIPWFSPFHFFLYFLHQINFDYETLLDWIISQETCFVQFWIQFLKGVMENGNHFQGVCEEFNVLLGSKEMNERQNLSESELESESENESSFSILERFVLLLTRLGSVIEKLNNGNQLGFKGNALIHRMKMTLESLEK